jgi:threonyl-tRNA synthetase
VQVDYNLPERFGLEYVGADNKTHRPIMIHRAPFGSMERFIGVLIEHFAGTFPLWLAHEQARVLTVSDKSEEYGRSVLAQMRQAGLRVNGDFRSEKLGAKVREAQLDRVPYMLVVGPRDAEQGTVSIRDLDEGPVGDLPLADAITKFREEVDQRTLRKTFKNSIGLGDSDPPTLADGY